jgi:hypothetical protein
MSFPPLKTTAISTFIFALLWPIIMLVSSGQTPSPTAWIIAVMIFALVSGAAFFWRYSRDSKRQRDR